MNRIRELREEKSITQVRLSIELEVSQETVSAYENGKHDPSVKILTRLREIFGVTSDYILGLSENRYDSISASQLSSDETALIEKYRKLDLIGKENFHTYADGYLACMKDHRKKT